MDGLIILFIVIAVIRGLAAKDQAQKKKAQPGPAAQQPDTQPQTPTRRPAAYRPAPPRPMTPQPQDDRFPTLDAFELPTENAQGSMPYASAEGSGLGGSLAGTSDERRALYSELSELNVDLTEPANKEPLHVVKPLTESRHGHVESSMTGIQPQCDPMPEDVHAAAYEETSARAQMFALDKASIVRGFLYGEILGKPKALRR